MKPEPKKTKLPEYENTVFPDKFNLNESHHAHHLDQDSDTKAHKPMKPDSTAFHHPVNKRPRQLPGRHH